jgi:hypothetical protein
MKFGETLLEFSKGKFFFGWRWKNKFRPFDKTIAVNCMNNYVSFSFDFGFSYTFYVVILPWFTYGSILKYPRFIHKNKINNPSSFKSINERKKLILLKTIWLISISPRRKLSFFHWKPMLFNILQSDCLLPSKIYFSCSRTNKVSRVMCFYSLYISYIWFRISACIVSSTAVTGFLRGRVFFGLVWGNPHLLMVEIRFTLDKLSCKAFATR